MKRLKRALKWIAIVGLVLIAVLIIVHSVRVWRSDRRLEAQLAVIRAAGEPLTLAECAPARPVPPEENAATYLRRAEADVMAISREIEPIYDRIYQDQLSDGDLRKIGSAWEAYPNVLPLLEQAAGCEHYDSGLDYTVGPKLFLEDVLSRQGTLRTIARILLARGLWQLHGGHLDEAAETTILLLRLCRQYDHEPLFIVNLLISFAGRGTAMNLGNRVVRANLGEAAREALESELALHDMVKMLQTHLQSERAFVMERFRKLPVRNLWFMRRFWNEDQSMCLNIMAEYVAAAPMTYADSRSVQSRLDSQLQQSTAILAKLMLPSIQAVYEGHTRTIAQMRCLRVLNAIHARQLDGDAEIRLDDLGLPSEATIDPYDGKPLRVKRLPEGWLVYAVGRDLKDDGGTLEDRKDVGLGEGEDL